MALLGFGAVFLLLLPAVPHPAPLVSAAAYLPPHASTGPASPPSEDDQAGTVSGPAIIVGPPALEAALRFGQTATRTLWITNSGDADLTFVIREATRTLALAAGPLERPRAEPVADAAVWSQVEVAGEARAIIYLREQADLSPAYAIGDRAARGRFVYERLRATAERSGGPLRALLEEAGAEPRVLLAANAIAATLDATLLREVAGRPEVAAIGLNRTIPLPEDERAAGEEAVEWNIQKIRADQTWSTFGVTGQGVTVGLMDVGVLYTHPALVNQYRGNLGGGNFDHNYNWYDFYAGQPAPYDPDGRGTFGMGLLVGDDGGSNQIGVAPGARWIAVKMNYTLADMHAAFDWMTAPTDLGGGNPRPDLRPQVGLAPWGMAGCDTEFQPDLQAWRAAGIVPVMRTGSSGPDCATLTSPGDLPEAVIAAATDSNDLIFSGSSRGPSCYGEIKPEVAAPGINVRSAWNDGGYQSGTGNSWSAAHLAGAAALVLSADPTLDVAAVEYIITSTAFCRPDLQCGGSDCHNNVYGWGRIDAFEAVSLALGGLTVDIPWLSESPTYGTVPPGQGVPITVTFDSAGLAPGIYRAALEVESNDPLNPLVRLPVTLTVQQCDAVVADFAWTPLAPTAGQPVTLTAAATGTPPIAFAWDLGDGTPASGQVVYHTYLDPGPYTVVLTATNCQTGTAVVTHTVTVVPACEPVGQADFGWMPLTPTAGQAVTLTASVSGTPPITYIWRFGDDSPLLVGPAPVVTHSYDLPGDYLAVLTATNCVSATARAVHTITVAPPACVSPHDTIVAWLPSSPTAGLPVTLTATASGTLPLTFTWDLGDGTMGHGGLVVHTYSAAGVYTVVVTATNACGWDVADAVLVVAAPEERYVIYLPLVIRGL